MSTGTPGASAVFDASAALRAAIDRSTEALSWFRAAESGQVVGAWPDLVFAEAAHGLTRLVRGRRISAADALRELARILAAPVRVEPVAPLVIPAVNVALERAVSVYDATYVVLAERLDASLITADRRLAAATDRSILITA